MAYVSKYQAAHIEHMLDLVNGMIINPNDDTSPLMGYRYMGGAVPSFNPGTPTTKVFYLATQSGTYTYFGNITVSPNYIVFLKWNNGWTSEQVKVLTDEQFASLEAELQSQYTEFSQAVIDQVAHYKPIVIEGDVTNAPDEEDLTSVDGLLKFKDRSALYGMAYVILRRDKSFAEQITLENCIYEIRYDFDLGGQSVTIPSNCVLKFDGGCLSNGTLVGQNTGIESPIDKIFNTDIYLLGSWNIPELFTEYFGAKGDNINDDTLAIQSTIDNARERYGSGVCNVRLLSNHVYKISDTLRIPANMRFGGQSDYQENSRSGWFRSCIHQINDKDCIKLFGRNYSNLETACRLYIHDIYITGVNYELNNHSGISVDLNSSVGISQTSFNGLLFENYKYGINIDVKQCLSVEFCNITTSNNTIGIGIYLFFTVGCWGLWIKDSYIAFTRIGGISFRSDGGISGPLNITNTYIESCGNEYSLDTYKLYGCFGLKIMTLGNYGGLVNIDNCYFESNCPTRDYGDGTINIDPQGEFHEVAGEDTGKGRYIYISDPDLTKTAELLISGIGELNVNITHTHFSVNCQTISIVKGGMVSMKDCNLYRPNRGVDPLLQDSIIYIVDEQYNCSYVGVNLVEKNISFDFLSTPIYSKIKNVIKISDQTNCISGSYYVDYPPTNEKYEYYRGYFNGTTGFYYGKELTFYLGDTNNSYPNGLIFAPFKNLSEVVTRINSINYIYDTINIILLNDYTYNSRINFPSGKNILISSINKKLLSGNRLIFNNCKVNLSNLTINFLGVLIEGYNVDLSVNNSDIEYIENNTTGVLFSSGISRLSLDRCNISLSGQSSASNCKINRKESGILYTKLKDCINPSDIPYESDDLQSS